MSDVIIKTEPTVTIKSEPIENVDPRELEKRMVEILEKNPSGIRNSLMQAALPSVSVDQMMNVLNSLLSQGRLDILKKADGEPIYQLKDPKIALRCKGTDAEDKVIYLIIEKAENKGIWVRDIRFKSNLSAPQVNKVLKSLESKKLIKSVKPVNASKKKIYMLYDLEPDSTVTGGAWYTDQEFESEFVDVLIQLCHRFLLAARPKHIADPILWKNRSYKSSKDTLQYIVESKISKVELAIKDIESILDTLVFDGKAEKLVLSVRPGVVENLYRVVNPPMSAAGLMCLPCGLCPIFSDCHEGSFISPSTCPHMKDCLDF